MGCVHFVYLWKALQGQHFCVAKRWLQLARTETQKWSSGDVQSATLSRETNPILATSQYSRGVCGAVIIQNLQRPECCSGEFAKTVLLIFTMAHHLKHYSVIIETHLKHHYVTAMRGKR